MTVATPAYRADRPATADDVGTVASKSGLACKEYGFGPIRCTEFTFTNMTVTMTDEAGVVLYGGQKLYDFPEGGIKIIASHANLALLGTGNVSASWDGDFSLGTVTASNNATLLTTEQNILPSTSIPQADASKVAAATGMGLVTAIVALTNSTGRTPDDTIANHADLSTYGTDAATIESNVADLAGKINEIIAYLNNMSVAPLIDGTATAADLFLNFLVDDTDHNGGGITVTSGTIRVFWMLVGDD